MYNCCIIFVLKILTRYHYMNNIMDYNTRILGPPIAFVGAAGVYNYTNVFRLQLIKLLITTCRTDAVIGHRVNRYCFSYSLQATSSTKTLLIPFFSAEMLLYKNNYS